MKAGRLLAICALLAALVSTAAAARGGSAVHELTAANFDRKIKELAEDGLPIMAAGVASWWCVGRRPRGTPG